MTDTIETYMKGAGPDECPVTINAPIIINAAAEDEAQQLLDFVQAFESHSNTLAAGQEAARLRSESYFSAASLYLTRQIDKGERSSADKVKLRSLVTPGALSDMFGEIAACMRNTIISSVIIAPSDFDSDDVPTGELFWHRETPSHCFEYGDHSFSFGFIQVREEEGIRCKSSTTIPFFTLDKEIMTELAPHQPRLALEHLQAVLTAVNHDMIHHLHSPAAGSGVVYKFTNDGKDDKQNPLWQWGEGFEQDDHFEAFSQLFHGKILMANEALVEGIAAHIDGYFDELERIGAALPAEKAHDMADYMTMALMQGLMRAFPLNHPLMTQCLDRLEKASPLTAEKKLQQDLATSGKMFYLSTLVHNLRKSSDDGTEQRPPLLKAMREQMTESFSGVRVALEGYRQQGFDFLPDDDRAVTSRGLKLLQLACLSDRDAKAHVPRPVDAPMQKLRAATGEIAIDMIRAVAKTTGFTPK